jgi:hypothetical protein
MFDYRKSALVWFLATVILANGCSSQPELSKQVVRPMSMRDVPAQRLGFRFEPDVPAPANLPPAAPTVEKLPAIQADFDQNRPTDTLERTVASPDRARVLAVYNRATDEKQEFRLDVYDASGRLLKKITPENLSLVFPDSIAWSPNGETIAFAASKRIGAPNEEIVQEAPTPPSLETENQNTAPDSTPSADASPTPTIAPTQVAALRTEQIYTVNRDGNDLQALTQNEGLIYFHFVWSPDSSALAALACRENEWNARPPELRKAGRPRLVDKNKKERLLDDNLTEVFPLFSPDSSKVATAFGSQIRIYDTAGNPPTAAAIPLQQQLLQASINYDARQTEAQSAAGGQPPVPPAAGQPPASYNPIVTLRWAEDNRLYLQTGFVRDYPGGETVRSFLRWHVLNLSPQSAVLN